MPPKVAGQPNPMQPNASMFTDLLGDFMESRRGGDRATAAGTRLRASMALKCSRAIGYEILGAPKEKIEAETLFAFEIGQRYHDIAQELIMREFPEAQMEVVCDFTKADPPIDISCHADFTYKHPELGMVCGEAKSISGYGYLVVTGGRKSEEGPGPKQEHVIQATISALAPQVEAQYIHMIYFDKDKHGIAEWILNIDAIYPKYGAPLREIAQFELERMTAIVGVLDQGQLPKRYIPGIGEIAKVPGKMSGGKPWNCCYCSYNEICAAAPAGRTEIPVELRPKEEE